MEDLRMDYRIAFWNVENLFDEQNSPHRTEKLQRTIGNELRGWTSSSHQKAS
jgi:hypothetical protein